jgi:hypothetical protein
MSTIKIHNLTTVGGSIETLTTQDADRVVGGIDISFDFTLPPGGTSSSSSSSRAGSVSILRNGVRSGYDYALEKRNGQTVKRTFTRYGTLPDDFPIPSF